MSRAFGSKKIKKFGSREFLVKPISISKLSEELHDTLEDSLNFPKDFEVPHQFPLLRLCNPNITEEELIEIARAGKTHDLLVAFNSKLPLRDAIALIKPFEEKSWEYEQDSERLAREVTIENTQSALQDYEEESLSGWIRTLTTDSFMSKKPEILEYFKSTAPVLFDWFTALEKTNLFRFFVMNNPLGGDIHWQHTLQEFHGPALLTEFVRMKREGDLDDEESFELSDWDEEVEEEFEEFISDVHEGLWENDYSDTDFDTALHLPKVYFDQDIPAFSRVDIDGGNVALTTSADEATSVEWEISEGEVQHELVGVQGGAWADGGYPVLPLFNAVGELEMILVCLDYEGESVEDVVKYYISPLSYIESRHREAFPYYIGDVECNGELLISDAVWTEFDKTPESVLLTDLPIDTYGLVAFVDFGPQSSLMSSGSSDLTGLAFVRGAMKRKYQLIDALYPEAKNSSLAKSFARILRHS